MARNSRQDLNPTIPILSAMMEARFWHDAPEKWWQHDYWKMILAFFWTFLSPFQGLLLAWCVRLPRKWGPRLTGCYVEEEHCGSYCLDLLMLYLVVSIGPLADSCLAIVRCKGFDSKTRLYVRKKVTGVIHKWCVNAVITQYSKYRYDDVMIYVYWYLCIYIDAGIFTVIHVSNDFSCHLCIRLFRICFWMFSVYLPVYLFIIYSGGERFKVFLYLTMHFLTEYAWMYITCAWHMNVSVL